MQKHIQFTAFIAIIAFAGICTGLQTSAKPYPRQLNQVDFGDPHACTPFSILYALKFGGPFFNELYHNLPGANDSEKIADIIGHAKTMPSQLASRQFMYSESDGMFAYDVPALMNRMATHRFTQGAASLPLLRKQLVRRSHESKSGPFLARSHHEIYRSLQRGLPVIAGVYAMQYDSEQKKWVRMWAHAITIVNVQSQLNPDEEQFRIGFYEPWTGRYLTGDLYEETRQSFAHFRRDIDPSGREHQTWQDRTTPNALLHVEEQKSISSPFILLHSASFYSNYSTNFDRREIKVLDNIVVLAP